MGIYDRDYYRREGPSFLASITERGKVCKWLIGINVVCMVLQLLSSQGAFGNLPVLSQFTDAFELKSGAFYTRNLDDVPRLYPWARGWHDTQIVQVFGEAGVLQGQVWRLLTYAFLHAGFWHILFNMLFLWWFGSEMEDLYGPREFLAIYLTSALVGGIAFVGAQVVGLGGIAPCIGASGAVLAVTVLCAIHYPTRIIYLFFLLPVPIWILVVFMVAKDLYGLLSGSGSNTAFSVHLGGAAFAFVYWKLHWRLLSILPSPGAWRRRRARARLRIYHEEEEPPTPLRVVAPPARDVDEQLEARMDAVLQKVQDYGLESLTENERGILLKASEAIKRKRR
jgi:membrane associated rhomboid family serine protease